MRRVPLYLLLLGLAACVQEPEATDWRLSIRLPAAELPVGLHLAADGSQAWLVNGREKVPIPDIRHAGDTWTLHFPTFDNTLVLERRRDALHGTLTLTKLGYEQVMEVQGAPDPGYRFTPGEPPGADVTGRWQVDFTDDDGGHTPAVGEFDQQGAQVTGTFLTPTGDYRYLAGEMRGKVLHLSTFDGAHAFVFTATMQPDGGLAGDYWSGTRWHESWVAQRNFDASLPDAYSLTYLKKGYQGLDFTFPDLDGNPVSLKDAKYRGKVVLVNLSGTWCPNCADEVDFLSRYYRENHQRGLEIITLLYEHYSEFDLAARQGRALVKEHGIAFDVLVAGLSDKAQASETLPMLNRVVAFPTLIFVDRQGQVRRIHTGFTGPGTGEHFEQFKREFRAEMDSLLVEPADAAAEAAP